MQNDSSGFNESRQIWERSEKIQSVMRNRRFTNLKEPCHTTLLNYKREKNNFARQSPCSSGIKANMTNNGMKGNRAARDAWRTRHRRLENKTPHLPCSCQRATG